MSNLNTKTEILQAIWNTIDPIEKSQVVAFDLWIAGENNSISFALIGDELTLCLSCKELEKVNTVEFLKDLYFELCYAKEAVVTWGNPARKGHLIASWNEETQTLKLV